MNIFKEGDRNTKFYHAYIKYKRKCNTIHAIETVEGNWLHENAEIANDAVNYFKNLLTQENNLRSPIDSKHFNAKKDYTANLKLADILDEGEIWKAVNSIDSSKAVGPDGFTVEFYKKPWDIIKPEELLNDLNKTYRGGNLIYKLDLKKAADTISWGFIMDVLAARGWGSFTTSRGLKQRDPLSPTMFIIEIDYLSRMLDDSLLSKNYTIYHNRSNFAITHLIYADDIKVFLRAHKNPVRKVYQTLQKFQTHFGMCFNPEKCLLIFNKHVNPNCKQWASSYTGFSNSQCPIKYLGTMLLSGITRQIQFEEVINKITPYLSGWTHSFLSNGGRITLLKSILTTFPSYILQMTNIKKSTQILLERAFNRFLWSGQRQQMHWASWQKVAKPQLAEGIGFKGINQLFQINLCKLWIKLRAQTSLWALFMNGKYCRDQHPTLVERKIGDSKIWGKMLNIRHTAKTCSFGIWGKET
ncbi:uncharacterized protein LOC110035651 [Phalaenopsis equestris]|uniref:uncharacterized protein LOC110035651 n=1 Tax=Phalaenopsis equestris TaxID=78828 RepID=UPI0009E2E2B3|nr:uncharacterized protein LOC110035651 [Phalaenopsis equestris]